MAVHFLAVEHLPSLLTALKVHGYDVVGPMVRDGAIVYDHLEDISELPLGVMSVQRPGTYRLSESTSGRYFSWANGPSALKPLLYKARQALWTVEQVAVATVDGLVFKDTLPEPVKTAVIGVRPCDIAAMKIQDQHFLQSDYVDPYYQAERNSLFTVAVNCSTSNDTCFCASTGDGPALDDGYDLLLDELESGFLIRSGSDAGTAILEKLPIMKAGSDLIELAEQQSQKAAEKQKRYLIDENMHANLFSQLDSRRWYDIADRCLSCGNCTSVCPTCFCHRETETADLDGTKSTHYREWSSCFNADHSVMHGHALRDSSELRYRQWMLHKLGSWINQYGRSGCVGCGRCIAWCPVGIDFPAEANAISGEFDLWEQ
ncbi:4Fe-4S dicluster domain-containing protein [Teredinibacter franksiae]|uniref:4Fe-4S dicluster domain-containing protein n=1 Tax=Teredinibacter franksiae TaxID=2761453 RepID=UPI0016272E06|nr:4Fe-4S dicluster domain-containing protein [Teredinibacter franksiae]